jgi:hypothetical protein
VEAPLGKQLLVPPRLNDSTLIEHQDRIGIDHG